MNPLEKLIFKQAKQAIEKIDKAKLADIYVFSFSITDINDDPRLPLLTIGYNTVSNYNRKISEASSPNEAKWSYDHWLQNTIARIGNDFDSQDVIMDWMEAENLDYTNEDKDVDYDVCAFKGEKITQLFIQLTVNVVQKIHRDKITELPIIIHEIDYSDQIKKQNIEANGAERVKEFSTWIDCGMN